MDHTENQEWIARQLKIFQALDSYSEISLSGKGLHIIVKGKVSSGARKDKVEIYSSGRYMAMTGNVYNNKPIEDRQELLTQLWSEIRSVKQEVDHSLDEPEIKSDQEVLELARGAENGDKFAQLYDTELEGDNSAFDMALCNFLVFHSKNNAQVDRLFRASVRGKRDKITKRKDYLPRTIARARDKMQNAITPIDIVPLQEAIKARLAGSSNGKTTDFESVNEVSTTSPATIPLPPGLMGEIAQFIYAAAPRPVPEIALAAAIGLMAGICGRAYNISGSGLNQYLLLLAPTGTGKEAISSGVDKLMASIFVGNPASKDFVGPSDMASGQALVRYLDDSMTKCFMCMMDEFGIRLQRMSDPKANDAQQKLKQTFLELYQRTGKGQIFRPTIFADRKNNTTPAPCPNVTILGYSAPERLYDNLTEDMIVDGVLPRFSILEYKGLRPPFNYDHHTVFPEENLVKKLNALAINSLAQMSNPNNGQQWITVKTNETSEKMHRDFNTYCDSIINSSIVSAHKQLWSRAHLKALKLAALIAVGCDIYFPVITVDHLEYAIRMVCDDIRALLAKFENNETGKDHGESDQQKEMIRTLKEYCLWHWNKIKVYCHHTEQGDHHNKIVTKTYLNNRTGKLACFRKDKRGSRMAIAVVVKELVAMGILVKINGKIKELYQITDQISW